MSIAVATNLLYSSLMFSGMIYRPLREERRKVVNSPTAHFSHRKRKN